MYVLGHDYTIYCANYMQHNTVTWNINKAHAFLENATPPLIWQEKQLVHPCRSLHALEMPCIWEPPLFCDSHAFYISMLQYGLQSNWSDEHKGALWMFSRYVSLVVGGNDPRERINRLLLARNQHGATRWWERLILNKPFDGHGLVRCS